MVITVVKVDGSGFGPCLHFMFMVSFRICLVSCLMQLESRIRGQVERHVRVQLVCEIGFVIGIIADILDQFGASKLVDPVVLCDKLAFFRGI